MTYLCEVVRPGIFPPVLWGSRWSLAEAAGITAGSWYADPAGHVETELLVAGMLIMAGGHDGTGAVLATASNLYG